MKLNMEDLNTVKGLIHYLNDSFDGHGIIVSITLSGAPDLDMMREPSKGEIRLDDDGAHYAWYADNA